MHQKRPDCFYKFQIRMHRWYLFDKCLWAEVTAECWMTTIKATFRRQSRCMQTVAVDTELISHCDVSQTVIHCCNACCRRWITLWCFTDRQSFTAAMLAVVVESRQHWLILPNCFLVVTLLYTIYSGLSVLYITYCNRV